MKVKVAARYLENQLKRTTELHKIIQTIKGADKVQKYLKNRHVILSNHIASGERTVELG